MLKICKNATSKSHNVDYTDGFCFPCCRLSLERAERLYAEVEKAAQRLEQLAESRREKLRHAARIRALQEETTQVRYWPKGLSRDPRRLEP